MNSWFLCFNNIFIWNWNNISDNRDTLHFQSYMNVWLANKSFLSTEKRLSKVHIQQLYAKIYLGFVSNSTRHKNWQNISIWRIYGHNNFQKSVWWAVDIYHYAARLFLEFTALGKHLEYNCPAENSSCQAAVVVTVTQDYEKVWNIYCGCFRQRVWETRHSGATG